MYHQIFHIGNIVFYVMLAISFVLLLYKIIYHIIGLFPGKKFEDAKQDYKYAFLIPARNESKVIEELLISIKEQNYNPELLKTYVIVESEDDPTCEIAKRYERTEVVVRQHLERKGKGHALDEAVQHIFASGEKFDAFFICDADNVLTKDFVKEMNKTYDAGYEIALGYRNSKNWNDGWIATCSALTFSMINTLNNKGRAKFNANVILSGTGFYIASRILENLGGWKFFTLTEDYELSMYSAVNNIKSTYNTHAEFYDEQPKKLKASWNQRLRWIKGFSQANKIYKKKLVKGVVLDKENRWSKFEFAIGIIPILSLLVTAILYAVFTLGLGIYGAVVQASHYREVLRAFGISMGAIYTFFVLYTALMIACEFRKSNLKVKNAIICCFMGPFFMALYIPIYIAAYLKKEVKWVPIEHNVRMNQQTNLIHEVKIEESEE